MSQIKKGDYVKVFADPITCKNLEFVGPVTKVLQEEKHYTDADGNPMYRVKVRDDYGYDSVVVERDVSQKWTKQIGQSE